MVYAMFLLGRNFMSSLISTLQSTKNLLKTLKKPKNFFKNLGFPALILIVAF